MGWGRLYSVHESAGRLLSTCRTKADWYAALNTLGIEHAPQLDAEDSIRFWASTLNALAHPAARFFAGDLHADDNGTGDPDVCLVSRESASAFLSQFEQLGEPFFANLFRHDGPYGVGHAWLYGPLCAFLRETCRRGDAIVMLWEN
ncbi:hypothetical protein ACEPUD_16610 [Burkholderia ubonensis]|uniref:hypothetical protein n=1 Tax=Burkholderia ubonensis TaxID=101571 RepID=UPI00358F651D